MKNAKDEKALIKEEQKILNDVIAYLDEQLLKQKQNLTTALLQKQKAKEKNLLDTYGDFIHAIGEEELAHVNERRIRRIRDELYKNRIELHFVEETGEEGDIELKVGLHSLINKDKIVVCSWYRPTCRHYVLDNYETDFEEKTDKGSTSYSLKLKRDIEIDFDEVLGVTHCFPISGEEGEVYIADKFLQELLSRRGETGFRNIVFSIQRKQSEIIQAPFEHNMIVQGCAGSGKSMIMLHRLPIVLYDHSDILKSKNIYVITPSQAYIQMVENMRYELEISAVEMGTAKDYYDRIITRYGKDIKEYGRIYTARISKKQEEYAYSEDCIKDIRNTIENLIEDNNEEIWEERNLFDVSASSIRVETYRDELANNMVMVQNILDKNDKALRVYHTVIGKVLKECEALSNFYLYRKSDVLRNLRRQAEGIKKELSDTQNSLSKLNRITQIIAVRNHRRKIEEAQERLRTLQNLMRSVDSDNAYFEELTKIGKLVKSRIALYEGYDKLYEKNSMDDIYRFIANRSELGNIYHVVTKINEEVHDKYREYAEPIDEYVNKLAYVFEQIDSVDTHYIVYERYVRMNNCLKTLRKNQDEIIQKVYAVIMEHLGVKPNENGKLRGLICSPYLYTQILYQYQGMPSGEKESLITIDEAQGMEPTEIRLIKEVNGNKVILNLFGDERQHIEGTKGIDNWSELEDIFSYERYDMQENYRNASQITRYCNQEFHLDMQAINLPGQDVVEWNDLEIFHNDITKILTSAMKKGLSAIIVKDVAEAEQLQVHYEKFANRFHDLTVGKEEIVGNKWNVMTVAQSKGLEFSTVIALLGRMSENERYIACTRALNELSVLKCEIPLPEKEQKKKNVIIVQNDKNKKALKNDVTEKENGKVYENDVIRQFFINKGCNIIEMRDKGGCLWILGSKEEIGDIVQMAVEKFGISGGYANGKATKHKMAWYTKDYMIEESQEDK